MVFFIQQSLERLQCGMTSVLASKEAEDLFTEPWELRECTLLETEVVLRYQTVRVIWGVKWSREIRSEGHGLLLSEPHERTVHVCGEEARLPCIEKWGPRDNREDYCLRGFHEGEQHLETNWREHFEWRVGLIVLFLGVERLELV